MLVLSRYRDENIHIGDDIVITIVDIRGDRVRLGIQAPPSVSVHRKEIYDAIAQGKPAPNGPGKADHSKPHDSKPKEKSAGSPLEDKLPSRRPKGLPVEIDQPMGFGGGISDVVGG